MAAPKVRAASKNSRTNYDCFFLTREFQQYSLQRQIRVVSRRPRALVQLGRGGRLSRGFQHRVAWQLRDGARQRFRGGRRR